MAAHGKTAKEKTRQVHIEERRTEMLSLAQQGMRAEAIAEVFGVSRRTIDRDFDAVLQSLQDQRTKLGELVLVDHLAALDAKIHELHDLMYIHPDTSAVQLTIANPSAYDRWFKAMQERARLLNLYPHADQHTGSQVTVNQYYLAFDGSSTPQREQPDYIEGTTTPMLDDG